jgi:hypothetical protein
MIISKNQLFHYLKKVSAPPVFFDEIFQASLLSQKDNFFISLILSVFKIGDESYETGPQSLSPKFTNSWTKKVRNISLVLIGSHRESRWYFTPGICNLGTAGLTTDHQKLKNLGRSKIRILIRK